MQLNAITLVDGYKVGHKFQYAPDTTFVYSNFTARSSRLAKTLPEYINDEILFVGLQGVLKDLHDRFESTFFSKPKDEVLAYYKRRMDGYLGEGSVGLDHIAALHDLGFLPVVVKALPEGSLVPTKVPVLVIYNYEPEFAWVTNMLETVLSSMLWQMCTNATVAFQYRCLLEDYAVQTGSPLDFVLWQGHDFSFRGMPGPEAAAMSGAAHLFSFLGTDTLPALDYVEQYYDGLKTYAGGSVPASEHSVSSTNILALVKKHEGAANQMLEAEKEFFLRYITEIYPTGVASYVADTYDFWGVLTEVAPACKEAIMNRQPNALGLNKVVFRPDSGDPVKILVGDPEGKTEAEVKGAVEVLWDTFGGTITDQGYKLLDCHVGLIYGDSITLERAQAILSSLKAKGFASGNVVFGIGSYTYQYNTRDTFGFAIKTTTCAVGGELIEIYKDPKTDNGVKKSAKGLLFVDKDESGRYVLHDQASPETESMPENMLEFVYDGRQFVNEQSLEEIRHEVNEAVKAKLNK